MTVGVALMSFWACGRGDRTGTESDASTDTDSDADSDTDTGTGTDSGTDTGTGTETDTTTDTDTATDTDTCTDVDAGSSDGCVRYVNLDVAASGDGLSWTTAFKTVQEGIDAAYSTLEPCEKCQIWIAEGSYYIYVDGVENTVDVKPGIELYGGFDGAEAFLDQRDWTAHVTTLDGHEYEGGGNRVQTVVTTRGRNVVDGFVITGGYIEGFGSGVLMEGPDFTLANSTVRDNSSWGSGGIYSEIEFGTTVLKDSTFSNNGGITLGYGDFTVQSCVFDHDSLSIGLTDAGLVSNCFFNGHGLVVIGGTVSISASIVTCEDSVGIRVLNGALVEITSSEITNCTGSTTSGGGLDVVNSTVHVSDTVFAHNQSGWGGGAYLTYTAEDLGETTFTNCIFYDNHAVNAGDALWGRATVEGCVFVNTTSLLGWMDVRDSVFFKTAMKACNDTTVHGSVFTNSGAIATGVTSFDNVVMSLGGLGCLGGDAISDYTNCGYLDGTVAVSNVTQYGGTVYANSGCDMQARGSILGTDLGGVTASYSVTALAGEGNITADPLWVGDPASTGFLSDVYFDEGTFQTELTDDTASWEPGELAGLLVVTGGGAVVGYVAESEGTVIRAWGDLTADAAAGDAYEIIDLHLQAGSPAIDAGYGIGAAETDVEGNPRYDDPSATNAYDCGGDTDCVEYVDMGAFERQP
jgi:hypothetical protein